MKCRVFIKPDGSVIYSWPSQKHQDVPNFEGCKFPPECDGLAFVDIDEADLAPSDSKTGDYHEMIYLDGATLKQDKAWEVMLMPPFLIKQKHIEDLNAELDAQLESQTPDLGRMLWLNRAKEKAKDYTDDQLYNLALNNLKDGDKKPVIVSKLIAKIGETNG